MFYRYKSALCYIYLHSMLLWFYAAVVFHFFYHFFSCVRMLKNKQFVFLNIPLLASTLNSGIILWFFIQKFFKILFIYFMRMYYRLLCTLNTLYNSWLLSPLWEKQLYVNICFIIFNGHINSKIQILNKRNTKPTKV